MRARFQRRSGQGSARSSRQQYPSTAESSSPANDVVSSKAVKDFTGWRALDVSTKLLIHQPLEPTRALANRMYNDRALLHATHHAPPAQRSPSAPPVAAEKQQKGGGQSATAGPLDAAPRQSAPALFVEGALSRQWTQARFIPFGLEALNTFQLPAIALATSSSTEEMLATVVALLHRQGRASASERKQLPPPIVPLFYDFAEEVEVGLAAPFVVALAEQELRGVAPGLTPRVTLLCSLVALRILKEDMQRERASADALLPSSVLCGSLRSDGRITAVQTLSAKVARVGSASEINHLTHHLCKCVNRGLVTAWRRGNRSGKTSLSSSMRASAALDASRRSQSRASPDRDGSLMDSVEESDASAPLSTADLDDLVDPIFAPPEDVSLTRAAPTVSARTMRKALGALASALWSVYEVAIPLAALLSARTDGSGSTSVAAAGTATRDQLWVLSNALHAALQDERRDVATDFELDVAEAVVVEDFARVLKATAACCEHESGPSPLPPFPAAPSDLSLLEKGLSIRGQGCSPLVASVWMQSFDWTLHITESVLMAEYGAEPS